MPSFETPETGPLKTETKEIEGGKKVKEVTSSRGLKFTVEDAK
jgi:hypothetical protein